MTLQKGDYGPVEGTRARGYQEKCVCGQTNFLNFSQFLHVNLIKRGKGVILGKTLFIGKALTLQRGDYGPA